jgi:hypothetical protein
MIQQLSEVQSIWINISRCEKVDGDGTLVGLSCKARGVVET